jgi:transposase
LQDLASVPADIVDVAFDQGRDAVRALVVAQGERITALEAELDELKRLMGRNSSNSSMAPSKDSPQAREQRGKKRSSGKKQGGQPGHQGRHRKMIANPDRVVEHWPSACQGCGGKLAEREAAGDPVAHQVSEVIVRVEASVHVPQPQRTRIRRCSVTSCRHAGTERAGRHPRRQLVPRRCAPRGSGDVRRLACSATCSG